jgi:hypothetical protein
MSEPVGAVWSVEVKGHEADIAEIASRMPASLRIRRQPDPDGWELTAERFKRLLDAESVRGAATEMLVVLNGIATARLRDAEPMTIGDVCMRRADGSKQVFAFADDTIHVRDRAFAATAMAEGSAVAVARPFPWKNDLDLADSDEEARAALAFLSIAPPNWHALYAALEIVLNDRRTGGREGLQHWANISTGQIRRFTQTANSFKALGITAHHGPEVDPPSEPMTLADGREFVRSAVAGWLDEHHRLAAEEVTRPHFRV